MLSFSKYRRHQFKHVLYCHLLNFDSFLQLIIKISIFYSSKYLIFVDLSKSVLNPIKSESNDVLYILCNSKLGRPVSICIVYLLLQLSPLLLIVVWDEATFWLPPVWLQLIKRSKFATLSMDIQMASP